VHNCKLSASSANPRALISSPLRNRWRVELTAPVADVWALIGDVARLPEYSSGLERVEPKCDQEGAVTEYVCHFKPQEPGVSSIAHRELMRWYEPYRGFASSGEEGNAFGLMDDLNLVRLGPSKRGTLVTWEVYYDAGDLDRNKASSDEALADIAQHLIHRFGGAILERYLEPSP
jgi:carbon monoxide dehydrogenase subunit G